MVFDVYTSKEFLLVGKPEEFSDGGPVSHGKKT